MRHGNRFPTPQELLPLLDAVLALDPGQSRVDASSENKFASERVALSAAAPPAGALSWLQVQLRR